MRKIKLVRTVIASFAILTCVAAAQQSSTEKKDAAPAMQAPKPGPEMDKVKFLIGAWTLDGEYLKSPMIPQGGKSTGWYKAALGPGGFSVIADFEGDGPLGKEIGHQVFSWDPKQNGYTVVTVGNNFPGALIGKAHWEGQNLVTETEFEEGDGKMFFRAVYSGVQEKTLHIEESFKIGDGPFQLMWKTDATKK